MNPRAITNLVTVLVVLVWAAAVVVSMVDHNYAIPGTVQLTMAAAGAYLWGSWALKKAKPDDEKKPEQKPSEPYKRDKTDVPRPDYGGGEDYYTKDTKP